jgi:hypothetical protein
MSGRGNEVDLGNNTRFLVGLNEAFDLSLDWRHHVFYRYTEGHYLRGPLHESSGKASLARIRHGMCTALITIPRVSQNPYVACNSLYISTRCKDDDMRSLI